MGQSATIVRSPDRCRVISTASSAMVAFPLAVVAMLLSCWALNFTPQDLQAADLEVKPFGAKVLEFVQSPSNRDIIILGSSLALTPAVRIDEAFHGQRHRYDQWYYDHVINHYTRADHLQELLSRGHAPVSITNLALSSSMMSDYLRIAHILLQAGKRPKLVICPARSGRQHVRS